MNAQELLDDLTARGVRLLADGDRLALDAPEGMLTPELLERLKAHKAAILAALSTWNAQKVLRLIQAADNLVASHGVSGHHPAIRDAAALVTSAHATRDMATLSYALEEFRLAVKQVASLKPSQEENPNGEYRQ